LEAGQPPKQVKSYKPGDYFGELALLKNEPRAANVIAKTKLKVVSLERNSFKRLLGPLDQILKRNMDSYGNYL
jgi:cAMP-dependent protein kinase regulator